MTPLPDLTDENRAFWTGGKDGRLLIVRCDACDYAIHPPQVVCPVCLSRSVTPRAFSGAGRVESWTINRRRWFPDMDVPFALAIVSLDEAPHVRITAQVLDADALQIGDRVQVTFLDRGEVWIPAFRLTPV